MFASAESFLNAEKLRRSQKLDKSDEIKIMRMSVGTFQNKQADKRGRNAVLSLMFQLIEYAENYK